MNDDSILRGTLSQLGQTVKQAVKQVVNLPGKMAEETAEEVKVKPSEQVAQPEKNDEETKKVIESLYAKSPNAKAPEQKDDEKKILELKLKLHKENYYDPTFNPPKKQEERPLEKVEKEKMQDLQDLQRKEEEKPPPLAAQRARERVEKFPGASG